MPRLRTTAASTVALLLLCAAAWSGDAPRTADSALTPTKGNDNRHQQFLARIKQGPVGLLFVGDSITDFWPGRSKETWEKFAPYHPADFGISGECTEQTLWHLTNGCLDGIDPKAVVIMIGTNNIGHYGTEEPGWTAAGVKKVVATVREKLPKAKILLLGVFPRDSKASPMRKKVEAINEIIKGYDDGATVHYLDIGTKFLDDQGELPKDIMPDKLHPNAKGYQIWYDAMWPTLEPLLK
jgi:lysophospholipase L1-like esterase